MAPITNTDLFYVERGGTGYQATGSDLQTFLGGGGISGADIQAAAAAPGTRSDGTALVAGDVWYDTANNVLYGYDGAGFNVVIGPAAGAAGTDTQAAAAAPATRSDGGALVEGDLWWDTVNDVLYGYDGAGFNVAIGPSAGGATQFDWQSGASAGVPTATFKADGITALVDGDQFWDSTNDKLYAWDGAAWNALDKTQSGITHTIVASAYLQSSSYTGTAVLTGEGVASFFGGDTSFSDYTITLSNPVPNTTDYNIFVSNQQRAGGATNTVAQGLTAQWVSTSQIKVDPALDVVGGNTSPITLLVTGPAY